MAVSTCKLVTFEIIAASGFSFIAFSIVVNTLIFFLCKKASTCFVTTITSTPEIVERLDTCLFPIEPYPITITFKYFVNRKRGILSVFLKKTGFVYLYKIEYSKLKIINKLVLKVEIRLLNV